MGESAVMCFSARASFLASGALVTIGAGTLARTSSAREVPFAAIPLLFAAHQASEGLLWLTGPGARWERLNKAASYAFFSFALVVWPLYIPLSVLALEPSPLRRMIALAFEACGILLGAYFVQVITKLRVPSRALYEHIVYDTDFVEGPRLYLFLRGTYLAICVVPLLVSSHLGVKIYGACQLASFVVAARWYRESLTSVWCYFAAVLSALIPVFMRI